METIDIRQSWLDYYSALGFKIIPSAPLVHPAFPMSFNMSAGLVQLDPLIRSQEKTKPKKECLVQKCFRHFDIEKVGDDSHLSFFEMPGAFEVIDFDESKTVEYLWAFLTKTLGIDPGKIWATTFNYDEIYSTTITQNKEVIGFLKELVESRLVLGNKDTNFWMQGGGIHFTDNMRLCGPQVEFFYQRSTKGTTENPLSTPASFIEIGNSISIKYFVDYHDMKVKELVNPSTESVIGLERVASVVETNNANLYETSFFMPATHQLSVSISSPEVRIICDHLKALLFLYAEEYIEPGKNGRNRIIRNLIRQILASCYLLHIRPSETIIKIVDDLVATYNQSYPEIINGKSRVLDTIFEHEQKYRKTLLRGKRQVDAYMTKNGITEVGEKEMTYFKERLGIPPKLFQLLRQPDTTFLS